MSPTPASPNKSSLRRRSKPMLMEDDSSIYSNIGAKSSPQQVAKTEALLQELEDQAPNLSKELKLKIVQAILEEEPNSMVDHPQRDSDEGRVLIELELTVCSYKISHKSFIGIHYRFIAFRVYNRRIAGQGAEPHIL